MKIKYIGTNKYRYRYFKSPLGFIKLILDVFIDQRTGYINIAERNLALGSTDEQIEWYANEEFRRIEAYQ